MSRPSRLPYLLAPGFLIGSAVLVSQACGGGQQPTEDPAPVCYLSHPVPDGGMIRPLRTEEWANLVVRSYHENTTSTQDCVGNTIEWRRTDRACDVHEPDDERPPQAVPITEDSVIVGRADSVAIKPVWVITHRFEDGDGFGPVAVTERTAEGVAIRAMGTLRLPIQRARLRLRETGGMRILVADGERCPSDGDEEESGDSDDAPPANAGGGGEEEEQEETCLRSSRLMPMVGDQLLSPEVRTPDGHCLGPALVHLSREHVTGIANGWERVFRLAASMEYRGRSVIIHEQVIAEDRDPRDPGRPARLFRTTDADRVIQLDRGGMTSRGIPLFERSIQAHGSTQLPVARAPNNSGQSGSSGGQARAQQR